MNNLGSSHEENIMVSKRARELLVLHSLVSLRLACIAKASGNAFSNFLDFIRWFDSFALGNLLSLM